jgi:hypothetical protein
MENLTLNDRSEALFCAWGGRRDVLLFLRCALVGD